MRVLELGCAPGKLLAWVAHDLGAEVSGLDYSERGIAWSRQLFETLAISGDLRHEDVFTTTFPPGSFDVVFSVGLIEHFEEPARIVRAHVALLKPGGTAIISVPDYHGLYGRVQRWFDAESLTYHNLDIMTPEALAGLAPRDLTARAFAYRSGRLSAWQISLNRRWPPIVARGVWHLFNVAGLLQPVEIEVLCPLVVVELTRNGAPAC
jgi:SAM-dependent methyltransferase